MTVQPRIAIIGSPWRRDENGDRLLTADAKEHEAKACAAGEELGQRLAEANCRLLVYSADEHSIERAVVTGFVKVRNARHQIEFRHPRGVGGKFPEQDLPEEPIKRSCGRSRKLGGFVLWLASRR